MAKIVNFSPSKEDKNVGVKTDISFTFTELAPFQPNSDSVPDLPGSGQFTRLDDLQARKLRETDATLYVDATPDRIREAIEAQIGSTNEKKSLVPATETQINNEIGAQGRITKIREDVRIKLSNFIAIKYNVGGAFKQIPPSGLSFLPEDVKLERATKGDILDIANEFRKIAITPTINKSELFCNYVMAATEAHTFVTSIISENEIVVQNNFLFQEKGFITLVFTDKFLNPSETIRDMAVFKVKQIKNTTDPITIVLESEKYSLLSKEEQELPLSKRTIIAVPGIPILIDGFAVSSALSLYGAEQSIQAEIPKTTLYVPKNDPTLDTGDFVGNLYIPSITVLLYEDDQEVFLIKEGKATPGTSINYSLITKDSDTNRYGDVNVLVKLNASSQSLAISGATRAGTKAVKVRARIANTPGKLAELGKAVNSTFAENLMGVDALLEVKASTKNFAEKPKFPGEFYFNQQVQVKNKIIDLNKYGTVRLLDKVEIVKTLDGVQTVIHSSQVEAVDVNQGLIVLNTPIPINLGIAQSAAEQEIENRTRYSIRIPQSPLNPGRKYRIVVHAMDREEVRFDVNRDGQINIADQQLVESRSKQSNLKFPNLADIAGAGSQNQSPDNKVDDSDINIIKEKLEQLNQAGVQTDPVAAGQVNIDVSE